MRCYITGTNHEGRSDIVRTVDLDPAAITQLWPVDGAAVRRPEGVPPVDLGLRAGQCRWRALHFPPNSRAPIGIDEVPGLHWTASIDLDLVMQGSIELELEAAKVTLGTGDSTVMTGVAHAWRAGVDGCLLLVALVGVEP